MKFLKKLIKETPVLKSVVPALQNMIGNRKFQGTAGYWEERYKAGGNSGSGSYNRLAEFKALVINDFIIEKGINTTIEFGCGDGNNLSLIKYPKYIGLDISPSTIQNCIHRFRGDDSKSFYAYNSFAFLDNHKLFAAELSLSLDVIFHLVEDDIFTNYMKFLFQASTKYVVIYSWDYDEKQISHQRSRKFSKWVAENQLSFKLIKQIDNPYKFDPKDPDNTSNACFMIYERI